METEELDHPTCVLRQQPPTYCGDYVDARFALQRCLTELRLAWQERANGPVTCAAEPIEASAEVLARNATGQTVLVHTAEQSAGPFEGHAFTDDTIAALRDTGSAEGMMAVCACDEPGCGCLLGVVHEGVCQVIFAFRACGLREVHIGNWRLRAD